MKSFRQYLNEVSHKQLEPLEDYHDDRPFDNIFGDKLRIVVPLRADRADYQLINALAKRGYAIDLENDTAISNLNTFQCQKCKRMIQLPSAPKQCPSCKSEELTPVSNEKIRPKQRKERIGTVLFRLSQDKEDNGNEWTNYLHWWAKNKGKKAEQNDDESGISIILSRSPIDIIRMSDHREFNSCHSPPQSKNTKGWKEGSYFHCAVQEAKTGGAVAYAIHTSDLKKVRDLQAQDIFKDRDRNIEGIEPLERQKLRRWTDGKTDLLLPEPKTYGIGHIDFQETILDYLKQSQKNVVDFANPPDFKKFNFKGGSYKDVNPADMWNNFFDTNVSGDKKSLDRKSEGEGHWSAERMEKIANSSLKEHEKKWKHVYAYASVEEAEGQPYVYSSGGVSFEFDEKIFVREMPNNEELSTWGYRPQDPYTLGRAIKDALSRQLGEINFHENNGKITISVDIEHEGDGSGRLDQPEINDFENFLDDLDEIEEDYDKYYAAVAEALLTFGFIKDINKEVPLQHFKIDKEKYKPQVMAVSEQMWIGDLKGVKSDNISRKIKDYNHYESNYLKLDPTLQSNASVIFPFSTIPANCIVFRSDLPMQREEIISQPHKIFLQLVVPLKNQKILHTIRSIDQRFEYYEQRATQWWNNVKPGLSGNPTGGFSPKIPFARKFPQVQKQQQFDFDSFEEWLKHQESL